MTDHEKAESLCKSILKYAPDAVIKEFGEEGKYQAALLCSEAYYTAKVYILSPEVEDKIIKSWTEGKYDEFIADMYDTSIAAVHDVLVRRGYHAPHVMHCNYNIKEFNNVLDMQSKSEKLSKAIMRTYAFPDDQRHIPVKRALSPSKEEVRVIKKYKSEGTSLVDLAELSGRDIAEVKAMIEKG